MNIYNINSTYIMYGISYLLGYLFVLVFLALVGYERIDIYCNVCLTSDYQNDYGVTVILKVSKWIIFEFLFVSVV